MGLIYFTGILFFLTGAYLTLHVFKLVTTETNAIIGQDEWAIKVLQQVHHMIDDAVKVSRLAVGGQESREVARQKRLLAEKQLENLRDLVLPEERSFFERVELEWRTAVTLLEKMEKQRGRAGEIFQGEVLTVLSDLGVALQAMEVARREVSFKRVQRILQAIKLARTQLLFLFLPLLLVGIGLVWGMRRYVLRPFAILHAAADDVALGNFEHQITLRQDDEVGELIEHFNDMVRRLSENEQRKREFASMVAHEMRTPLTVLHLFSSLLLNGEGLANEEDKARAMEYIHRETINLKTLTDDLFDVACAEAGAFRVEPRLIELADELAIFLKPFEKVAREKNVTFTWDISSLPQAVVDGNRLGQAVRNLLTNAFKFAPEEGKVEVKGELRGSEIVIEVRDNGIGVPLKEQPHVFTRFYQVKVAEGQSRGGIGLGLAVVHEIVVAHKGKVEVHSEEGGMTCFRISLPYISASEGSKNKSDVKTNFKGIVCLCLVVFWLLFLNGCAAKQMPTEASQLASQGELASAATAYERIASGSTGAKAMEAWHQAAKLWIDPNNKSMSFRRALACFKRIDSSVADEQIARDARLWIFVITRMVVAEDAAAAARKAAATFKDVTKGSEQLRAPH